MFIMGSLTNNTGSSQRIEALEIIINKIINKNDDEGVDDNDNSARDDQDN